MSRKRLVDRIQAHRDRFDGRDKRDGQDYSAWFLHMVVFPSLRDIAEELDRRADADVKRTKGSDRGIVGHGEAEG